MATILEQKAQIDKLWETFWSNGISNPLTVIEQISYLFFIKELDEKHTREERKANRLNRPIENPVFDETPKQQNMRWSKFKDFAPSEMYRVVQEDVFPFIKNMGGENFAKYMKDAPWGIGIGIFERDIPAWNKFKIVSQIPPDSEYVFIWVRTGWIGVSWFAICNLIIFLGACSVVFFKIRNRSLMGIGAGWCAAFIALHLGGYANQILMQFPNILIFYGGLTTVFIFPKIENQFEEYENELLAKEAKKKRLKLEKKLAKRV